MRAARALTGEESVQESLENGESSCAGGGGECDECGKCECERLATKGAVSVLREWTCDRHSAIPSNALLFDLLNGRQAGTAL